MASQHSTVASSVAGAGVAVRDDERMSVAIVDLAGDTRASWSGLASASVGAVKRHVATETTTSVAKISLIFEEKILRGSTSLLEQEVPDGAVLQMVILEGVEVQIRTQGYRVGGRHFWGLDSQKRAFHAPREQAGQRDRYAEDVVTIETWVLLPALNSAEHAFSLSSSSCPDRFLYLDSDDPRSALFAVPSNIAEEDPDGASFMTEPATGNAVNIFSCKEPRDPICHAYARLYPHRQHADPVEILTEPFQEELPADEALRLLRGN